MSPLKKIAIKITYKRFYSSGTISSFCPNKYGEVSTPTSSLTEKLWKTPSFRYMTKKPSTPMASGVWNVPSPKSFYTVNYGCGHSRTLFRSFCQLQLRLETTILLHRKRQSVHRIPWSSPFTGYGFSSQYHSTKTRHSHENSGWRQGLAEETIPRLGRGRS